MKPPSRSQPVLHESLQFLCGHLQGGSLCPDHLFHMQLLNSVSQAVLATDLQGRIVFWNRAAETLYGWAVADVMHRNVLDVTPAESTRMEAEQLMAALTAGETWTGEILVQRKNGSEFWARVSNAPIRDDRGALAGIVGISVDVTEERAAAAALRKEQARFRALIKATANVIWVADAQGNVTDVGSSWADYTSLSKDDLTGWKWTALLHPDDRERVIEAWKGCLSDRTVFDSEHRMQVADGSYRWASVRAVPVFDANGTLTEWVGAIDDVDARKRFEKGLIDAKDEAEEIARLKSEILSTMSHEIRTPLTAIIGFSEILAERPVGDCHWIANEILTAGERLLDTLDSVLSLVQLKSGETGLSLVETDVGARVDGLLSIYSKQAEARDLYVRKTYESPPFVAYTDADALDRILTNLLNNALKFTHSGGVTVRLSHDENDVRIDVEDTGTGIGEEFLPHIFDEFVQESSGTTRTYEGVGLGLAITKRLVDLMDGRIDVVSAKGKGSTFTVRLPVRMTEGVHVG